MDFPDDDTTTTNINNNAIPSCTKSTRNRKQSTRSKNTIKIKIQKDCEKIKPEDITHFKVLNIY